MFTISIYFCIVGKFAFHFQWISLRLGLDENNIVIYGFTWRNPTEDFKSSPYVLYTEQVCIRFDSWSLIQSMRCNTSIKIKEIRIENVNICIEKCSHKVDDHDKENGNGSCSRSSNKKANTSMKIKPGRSLAKHHIQ